MAVANATQTEVKVTVDWKTVGWKMCTVVRNEKWLTLKVVATKLNKCRNVSGLS